ncbi:amidase domain-containing protein [Bifidobacterium actinocoloniiforme]|uniref:amidase domain-containing protein n=1 Tax=Bifidobacterium actinocoloniiforme TaxID=638619 RepID=UPI003B8A94BB
MYKEEGHGGNCTNFLSQAVYAGALRTAWGSSLDVKNEKVWTWNLAGIAHASRTWSGAQMNYTYMRYHSGAFTSESNPYRVGGVGLSTRTSATALMASTTPWWW